jgi:hypothetical protein
MPTEFDFVAEEAEKPQFDFQPDKEATRKQFQFEAETLRGQRKYGDIVEQLFSGGPELARNLQYYIKNPLKLADIPGRLMGADPDNPNLPSNIPLFTPGETEATFNPIVRPLMRTILPETTDPMQKERDISAVEERVGQIGSQMTTAPAIAALATGKPGVVGFGVQSAAEVPETIKRITEAAKAGDEKGVLQASVDLAGQAAAIYGAGKATVPKPTTESFQMRPAADVSGRAIETQQPLPVQPKEVPNAIQSESAQLFRDVQTQPEQGAQQVPVEGGSVEAGERGGEAQANVQQQAGTPAPVAEGAPLPVTPIVLEKELGVRVAGEGPFGILLETKNAKGEPGTSFLVKPGSTLEQAKADYEATRKRFEGEPDEPAPLKQAEPRGLAKDVRARLESGQPSEAGFVNLDILKQVGEFGKSIYQKGMDFAKWAADMVSQLGDKAKDYLQEVWDRITTSKPATVEQLLKRQPGHVTVEEIANLSPEDAASYWDGIKQKGLSFQEDGVLAGMRLSQSDLPALKKLQQQGMDDFAAAFKSGDKAAQSAAQGKNIWASGAIEGLNRKGPNYDLAASRMRALGGDPHPALNTESGFFTLEPVERAGKAVRDFWRSFSMQSLPKITGANREVGEAGVRYETAPRVARSKGIDFAERVVGPDAKPEFDTKFGTALTEDNLRGIKEGLRTESVQEMAKGNVERANALEAQVDAVTSLVGKKNSPFKTEAEYQSFLKQSDTQAAIDRHIQQWESEKDPLFRQANDLDPETELSSRGLQTGARVNLKNVMPDEGTPTTIGPAARSTLIRQTATLLRRDPFARQAKGTGQSYEGSYRELMAHGFEREYPVAKQHEFIKKLIDSGNAVISSREKAVEIGGEKTKGYLMRLRPWSGQFLHIKKSLAPEYESISGLLPANKIPYVSKAADFLTKQSIMGLAEGSTHVGNILSQVFTGVGPTANPMLNALLKSAGRSDLLISFPQIIIKAFSDRAPDMLRLAEIGAAKEPYRGTIGWVINKVDQGTRLYASDLYQKMAEKGWFEKTETGEREFVNQVGQYAKRLQPRLIQSLRDTGIQPFATAIHTFNLQGFRNLVAGPGAKSPTNLGALALRADKAAGFIGTVVLIAALNKLVSGNPLGPNGTQLGNVGWIGDDKKLHQFNVGKLSGWERGARITGIQSAIEAKRAGLSTSKAVTGGAKSIAGTALNYTTGPLIQTAVKAATGKRPGVPMVQEAKVAPPSEDLSPLKSQAAENLKTALQEVNPIVDTAAKIIQGKPVEDIVRSQLSRYTPRTGQEQKTIEALPKIVHSSELHSYVDALAKEARKLPQDQRSTFLLKRMKEDGLKGADLGRAQVQLHLKGVL